MSADLSFTAAMVQMCTSLSPEASFKQAESLIREASDKGADYVQTPEVSNLIQKNRKGLFELLAPEDEDLSLKAYRDLARELKIHIHVGSLALRATPERAVNRSFLIAPDGGILASYDKIHMFDIELDGGESYRESANYQPGETAVISDLPWGRIGLTICYDVRFPALYRALAESGAAFITVPSAFTVRTGEAHWHTLLRARAIENGCYIFAAAQAGKHESGRETLWPLADRRPVGRGARRRRQYRDRHRDGEDRSRQGRERTQDHSVAAAWPPFQRRRYRRTRRSICIWYGDRHDPVQSALRPRPRL